MALFGLWNWLVRKPEEEKRRVTMEEARVTETGTDKEKAADEGKPPVKKGEMAPLFSPAGLVLVAFIVLIEAVALWMIYGALRGSGQQVQPGDITDVITKTHMVELEPIETWLKIPGPQPRSTYFSIRVVLYVSPEYYSMISDNLVKLQPIFTEKILFIIHDTVKPTEIMEKRTKIVLKEKIRTVLNEEVLRCPAIQKVVITKYDWGG